MKKIAIIVLIIIGLVAAGCSSGPTCNVKTGECEGVIEDGDMSAIRQDADNGEELSEASKKTIDDIDAEIDEVIQDTDTQTEEIVEDLKEDIEETDEIVDDFVEDISDDENVLQVKEGELVKIRIEAEDEDGDELVYKFAEPLDENGEWQTEIGDAGEYDTVIIVDDGKEEIATDVTIIVNVLNRPPELEIDGNTEVLEGEIIELNIQATDPEGETVTITVQDDNFRKVDGKYIWETDYNDSGEYTITVTAEDSMSYVEKNVNIIITDVNRAPVIKNIVLE